MAPIHTVVAAILGKDLGAVAALSVFGLVGVWMVVAGVRKFKTGYEMRESEVIPTSAVASAAGAVEIQGEAKPLDGTVTAPYTETDCLAYTYQTKRREHDHGHDDDDHGPRYRTVDSGSDRIPFRVEDDAGSVVVDPSDGDVSMESHGLDAPGRDRRSESRLDVGETVHVYGTRREGAVGEDAAGGEVFVGDGEAAPLQVTDASAEEAVGRRLKNGAISAGLGAVVVVGATYFLLFG